MGEFYDRDGIYGLSSEDLDRIAVENAGVLCFMSEGYACPVAREIVPQAPEWGTMVIGTGGMGNCGTIVLRGRTRRTRALLRQGKIARLVEAGIPEKVAEVAISMQYGMEYTVVRMAVEALPAVDLRGAFRGSSHGAFRRWLGRESELARTLSMPRKMAAAAIAAKVLGKELKPEEQIGSLGEAMIMSGVKMPD